MKKTIGKRGLALILSAMMVMSLFTVCGFGVLAEGGTKELAMQTWNASALAEAATAVGSKNSHDYPIFTTYAEAIGRRSLNTSNYFIFGATVPREKDGVAQIYNGQVATMFVRLIADEGYSEGNLCKIDAAYAVNTYGNSYIHELMIDINEYESAPTQVDPIYGYEYKEFALNVEMTDDVYDDATVGPLELRVISQHSEYATTVYSIEFIDMEDNVMAEFEGEQMAGLRGTAGTYETVYSDPDKPAGIASYAGIDDPALASRTEPYSVYNGDGLNKQKNETYPLVDGLGATLEAGNYSYSFVQSTMFSLGTRKVYYSVTDKTTGEKIAELEVDKAMVDKTVGSDTGIFETRSVPFTVTEDRAGHEFTFQVNIFNQTDYKLRSASLNLVVDADATAPADAQAVIDAITNLDVANAQAVADARTAYDALSTLGQAWVGSGLANKLATYEKAQTDAVAVNEAITGLGNKDDITDANYTEKTEALKAAENQNKEFVKIYGQEIADKLIDIQALNDYRAAYDEAEAEAEEKVKQAAIQTVVDAITAIGAVDEITEENVDAKQELVNAAKAAVDELTSAYGQDVLSDVSNYANIQAAQDKIDEIKAVPEYTLGDANEDGEINASDALLALQHSVKLTELKDAVFSAADVDESGVVDATDALFILQYSVKLIDKFPAEK